MTFTRQHEVILLLLLSCTQAMDIGERTAYPLIRSKWVTSYEPTVMVDLTTLNATCIREPANTFFGNIHPLGDRLNSPGELSEACAEKFNNQQGRATVVFDLQAHVTISDKIEVQIFSNISTSNAPNLTYALRLMNSCNAVITSIFETLELSLRERIVLINSTSSGCLTSRMSPDSIRKVSDEWTCSGADYMYDEESKLCIQASSPLKCVDNINLECQSLVLLIAGNFTESNCSSILESSSTVYDDSIENSLRLVEECKYEAMQYPELCSDVLVTLGQFERSCLVRGFGSTSSEDNSLPSTNKPDPSNLGTTMEDELSSVTTPSSFDDVEHTDAQTTVVASQTTEPDINWRLQILNQEDPIVLKEGGSNKLLSISLWVNTSAICSSPNNCDIALDISISNVETTPNCRVSNEPIAQVVVGQPVWRFPSSHTPQNTSFCRTSLNAQEINMNAVTVDYPLRAKLDLKYDGSQERELTASLKILSNQSPEIEILAKRMILIEDGDLKATCQSVNDPHLTTFDGFQYNNFYHGEFILYKHRSLPFQVNVIYQQCSPAVPQSCNCAVAVQSGDDVIIMDRCYRQRVTVLGPDGLPLKPFNPFKVFMYLNGELTPGTKILEEGGGLLYSIYLPTGMHVKVMVNADLLNVWVVPSPDDQENTEGLCGTFDNNKSNDLFLSTGENSELPTSQDGNRPSPEAFIKSWRVEYGTADSLFRGLKADSYLPDFFCECNQDLNSAGLCSYAKNIVNCENNKGNDITQKLITSASTPTRRKRRATDISSHNEVIDMDQKYDPEPPKWHNGWNETYAQQFCTNHISETPVGELCAMYVPKVDFNQEIYTCMEDLKIVGSETWLSSAIEAMKMQCKEELGKNTTISEADADKISKLLCINDCSGHGDCVQAKCFCYNEWSGGDCSTARNSTPSLKELPSYGLCDISTQNCSTVVVYGDKFVDSPMLRCIFQEAEVNDVSIAPGNEQPKLKYTRAKFLRFDAVECPLPDVEQVGIRSYYIRVSNSNDTDFSSASNTLLFIPYDPDCQECNVNTSTCSVFKDKGCHRKGHCYLEGDRALDDKCYICTAVDGQFEFTRQTDETCVVTATSTIPDWLVALIAAIAGSLMGVLCGFLLYCCCCNRKSTFANEERQFNVNQLPYFGPTPYVAQPVHRSTGSVAHGYRPQVQYNTPTVSIYAASVNRSQDESSNHDYF